MATAIGSTGCSTSNRTVTGDQPNQPLLPSFPKQSFRLKSPVFRSFQSSWYKRWPWIHYDQNNDKVFCFTCLKASRLGKLKACASKGDDAFLSRGYTNWKDAGGGFSRRRPFIPVDQLCLLPGGRRFYTPAQQPPFQCWDGVCFVGFTQLSSRYVGWC